VIFRVSCLIPEGCFEAAVPPGYLGAIVSPRPANGLLLHLPVEIARQTAFQARFGQGANRLINGAELPLVRDDRFARGSIHLPNVTLHLTFSPIRTSLRIYGIDALPGTTVRVEVRSYAAPTGFVLASRTSCSTFRRNPRD